jgi:hypothetical protein
MAKRHLIEGYFITTEVPQSAGACKHRRSVSLFSNP